MDKTRTPPRWYRRHGRTLLTATASVAVTCGLFTVMTAGAVRWLDAPTAQASEARRLQPERVDVAMPEVYELANIALALTDFTDKYRHTVFRRGDYYAEVMTHFAPYRTHPLIRKLNDELRGERMWQGYYGFRENAVSYVFDGDRIRLGKDYPSPVWRPNRFEDHRKLVEDFARASGFRAFFEQHRSWYAGRVAAYRERVALASMLEWLDARFPSRYDRNRVVFSPLIYGSHSTQRFGSQTIMFVAGPDVANDSLPVARQNAQLARIVFTEIDHNYVNPMSDRFRPEIDRAFRDIPRWNRDTQAGMYATPYAVFNEYMTWGVFLLYARDTYDAPTFDAVRAEVTTMMEGQRGFFRFGSFMAKLFDASPAGRFNPDEAYRAILAWAVQ